MAYRGEDLDLRTLQSWTSHGREPADGTRHTGAGRSEPIWVDDLVLACCNDAVELAIAHRAGTTTLEHLLNAMTGVEAAADQLERLGVRVAALRRETGQIIASELPVVFTAGKGKPQTSGELEEVLRTAADIAYGRRAPATLDDVMTALLESGRDLPAVSVLSRHLSQRGFRDGSGLALRARSYPQDLRPELRDGVRVPARSAYSSDGHRLLSGEAAAGDLVHNGRADRSERAVRDALQREFASLRDETSAAHGAIDERLATIEQAVLGARRSPDAEGLVLERLAAIEGGLEARFSALASTLALLPAPAPRDEGIDAAIHGLSTRLAGLERTLATFAERLVGIEDKLVPDRAIMDRLGQLEHSVQAGMSEGARNWVRMGERFNALETGIASREVPRIDLGPLTSRLAAVETSAIEAVERAARVAERLGALEQVIGASGAAMEQGFSAVTGRVAALQTASDAQRGQLGGIETLVGARADGLQAVVQQLAEETAAAITQPVLQQLAATDEGVSSVGRQLSEQVGEEARAAQKHHTTVEDGLIRIASSQQTLATSLERWRLDTTGDLSIVSNRLEAIEQLLPQHAEVIGKVASNVASLQTVALELRDSRGRFRKWLFGTDRPFARV